MNPCSTSVCINALEFCGLRPCLRNHIPVFLCCQAADHNAKKQKAPLQEIYFLRGGSRDPHMPSCLLTGVYHLNSWSFKADNHRKDSVFSLLLTSSRIDSIRTPQNPDCLILFRMFFKELECNIKERRNACLFLGCN